nr:nucleotidyltransferase family protein [uncultured Blautia sp.]
MKTAGIIAEYNPFHTGHEYQIRYVREKLGADFVVIAMSGDFVQRGTPALFSKYVRAEMALKSGADLILELPVSSSTASAELFARGGVQLLDRIGVTDILCFGSECGDTDILMELAKILINEPAEFQNALRLHLKEGMTFPRARSLALAEISPDSNKYQQILSSPNNILGIEYCKSILRENSSILPAAIKREGSDYHENTLSKNIFPSASAIRNAVIAGSDPCTLEHFSPKACRELFLQTVSDHNFLLESDLDPIFRYCLLQETEELLCSYLDMSHALARRILSCRNQYETFSQFASLLKTKEITHTRIQRALLHMLLHIHNVPEQIPYARVLGFRKSSASLLREIKKRGCIPLLTKLSDASKILEGDPYALNILEETTFSSNLYENILAQKKNAACIHEYQKQIIIL